MLIGSPKVGALHWEPLDHWRFEGGLFRRGTLAWDQVCEAGLLAAPCAGCAGSPARSMTCERAAAMGDARGAAQVGPRKKALDLLTAAIIDGGRGAAYDVFAGLPHSEAGFAAFDAGRAGARMGLAPAEGMPLPRATNRRPPPQNWRACVQQKASPRLWLLSRTLRTLPHFAALYRA